MKEVGEALNNYRYKSHKHGLDVPCIGICTWEYIAGTDQLESLVSIDNLVRTTTKPLKSSNPSSPGSIQVIRRNINR